MPVATLFVIKGVDEGKRFELTSPVTGVGRDAGNLVRLHDTEVSRRHAELRRVDNSHVLIDLGSSNGTFVNNQPIQEKDLLAGDHIQFGQTILVYTDGAGPRNDATALAAKISMIARNEVEAPSAIVKAIHEEEGSRILAQPDQVSGPWLRNALANLSAMYQTTQAVSHILDNDQLLEKIMDLIFQTIPADRGCIMLCKEDAEEVEPKAARWRAGINRQERIPISRTVMDYVLKEGQGVLITDAAQDERFGAPQSMLRSGIREALCVPMKGRHGTLGVLYLDTRTDPQELVANRGGKLHEDHLTLAIAIGHQAALALEDTRYHQAMVQAERLAAIGQTIAAISHHVKNILQGLKTGSEVLRMGIKEKNDSLLQQGWQIVERNQGRIYDLVMDMLSYSKDREPALEPTNVNSVIAEVLELMRGRLEEKQIHLQTRLDEKLPMVPVDAEGLHRALLNLLGNAVDALEGRPNPTISIDADLEQDGLWLGITVADNGVGIPPEKQADLFKPFMSTKGARGTGLGLAVSRKILREHGGDILVESKPGKGSRFLLRLPVHGTPSEELMSPLHQTIVPEDRLS